MEEVESLNMVECAVRSEAAGETYYVETFLRIASLTAEGGAVYDCMLVSRGQSQRNRRDYWNKHVAGNPGNINTQIISNLKTQNLIIAEMIVERWRRQEIGVERFGAAFCCSGMLLESAGGQVETVNGWGGGSRWGGGRCKDALADRKRQ